MSKSQAGKGDKPRNCFTKAYREGYDIIDWGDKQKIQNKVLKEHKETFLKLKKRYKP